MITKLFTPMKVGNCTIPNKLVVPAMVTNYCDEDGFLTDRYMAYIEEKAKGGWGMIITEDYSIHLMERDINIFQDFIKMNMLL